MRSSRARLVSASRTKRTVQGIAKLSALLSVCFALTPCGYARDVESERTDSLEAFLIRVAATSQAELPIDLGDGSVLTEVTAEGLTLSYLYTVDSARAPRDAFDPESRRRGLALSMCSNPDALALLQTGLAFVYEYRFDTGESVRLGVAADDCESDGRSRTSET